MNGIEANEFAAKWISAWNRKDVNAVLEHYVDDAKFVSPKAATFVGSSLVEGKPSLSRYWQLAAKKIEFTLDHIVLCVLFATGSPQLYILYQPFRPQLRQQTRGDR